MTQFLAVQGFKVQPRHFSVTAGGEVFENTTI